ncbi:HAD-IIIA family hydrolase [Rurimicrobium arvi]|uniref:D,D-heptose 1,7-bisphosphate phosphatase n=1 Tax=Rurimicrobium arvi TaxID=2049916 RepID=A0ABP8MDF2_9BACT
MNKTKYTKDWSLFLDRDGVINQEIQGTYVTSWDGFSFCEGVLPALAALGNTFGNIVVVTNQRGVGRGIMDIEDLRLIHHNMQHVVSENGGRIDSIYACTSVDDQDPNRKPNVGMAMQAKEDFEQIDFHKSVMVGNNLSDMLFGKRMGMHTVFIATTQQPFELPHDMIDEQFPSLKEWADSLSLAQNVVLN